MLLQRLQVKLRELVAVLRPLGLPEHVRIFCFLPSDPPLLLKLFDYLRRLSRRCSALLPPLHQRGLIAIPNISNDLRRIRMVTRLLRERRRRVVGVALPKVDASRDVVALIHLRAVVL